MKKYALLVGITTYPKVPRIYGRDLAGCKNDVDGMEEQLKRLGFEIRKLINESATREGVRGEVEKLIQDVSEGDQVVLFYSGHGSQTRRPKSWPGRWFETIVPYDSGRGKGGPNRDILDVELDSWLTRFDARKAFVTSIFDSCNSGGMGRSRGKAKGRARQLNADDRSAEEPDLQRIFVASATRSREIVKGPSGWLSSQPRQARILAACDPYEWAFETKKDGVPHGAFSYVLIDALKQESAWESIDWERLFKGVKKKVKEEKSQNPVMQSDDRAMPELKKYAVVIGINDYESDHWPKLHSAVSDAEKIACILEHKQGYESVLDDGMLYLDSSKRDIEKLFKKLKGELADEADVALVIYFAGHGEQGYGEPEYGPPLEGQSSDVVKGYLVPKDGSDDPKTWIAMSWLKRKLDELASCRHLLLVLDCCYAGTFNLTRGRGSRSRKLFRSELERFLRGRARQCLYSAAYNELAGDRGDSYEEDTDPQCPSSGPHSPFARSLIEALKGGADTAQGKFSRDHVITATELQQYIDRDLRHRSRQTPGLSDLESAGSKGEFVFVVPGKAPDPAPDPPLNEGNNPWLGERSYHQRDAPLFFGRERVIVDLLEWLVDPSYPVRAILGASGSGKTSVVKAGLLHLLEHQAALEARARVWAKRPELFEDWPEGRKGLAQRVGAWTVDEVNLRVEDPWRDLTAAVERLGNSAGDQRLLFVDQLEEIYSDATSSKQALADLEALIRDRPSVKILVCLGSDFEAVAPTLADTLGHRLESYPLPDPDREDLEAVIEGPAAERVLLPGSSLRRDLLNEINDAPAPLSLLSIALSRTYAVAYGRRQEPDQKPGDRTLTRGDYQSFGGITDSLLGRARHLYETHGDQPGYQQTFRRLFLRMADVTKAGRVVGRQVERRELDVTDADEQRRIETILGQLVTARLAVAGKGATVEPACDALVDRWLEWVDLAAGDDEKIRRRLEILRPAWRDAARWHDAGRAPGMLWAGDPYLPRLLDIRVELNRLEQEFLDASYAELQLERTRRIRAEANMRLAVAGEWISKDPTRAALVLLEIGGRDADASAEHRVSEVFGVSRMREALASGLCRAAFESHADGVEAVAFSSDGHRFVTASSDGTARIWNVGSPSWAHTSESQPVGEPPAGEARVLSGPGDGLTDAAWSPDGRFVVTASTDGTARIWRTDGSGEPLVLDGHLLKVAGASWSPVDGDFRVVTASFDDTTRVWQLEEANGEPRIVGEPVVGKGGLAAAWSPDGKRILTASDDRTARVWKADGSAEERVLKHPGRVRHVAWSPDGKRLLTVCIHDISVHVWDAETGARVTRLRLPDPDVAEPELRAAWSPDSRQIATASEDGSVRVWTLSAPGAAASEALSQPVVLHGHRKSVTSLAWSADGRVVTASHDRTARVWSADGKLEPLILRGHQVPLSAAVVSPSGRCIVTVGYDGELRIWDVNPYIRSYTDPSRTDDVSPYPEETARSWDVGIGNRMVDVSPEGAASVWDAGVGKPIDTVFAMAYGVAFNGGGERVVVDYGEYQRDWGVDGSDPRIPGQGPEDDHVSLRGSAGGSRLPGEDGVSLKGKRRVVFDGAEARVFDSDDSGAGTGDDPVILKHPGEVQLAAIDTDGHRVVTACDDRMLRVWNLGAGPLRSVGAPTLLPGRLWVPQMIGLAFDPQGTRVVASPMVGPVSVWDADGTGEPVVLPGQMSFGGRVAFSPDGSRVAEASSFRARVSIVGRAALQTRIREITTVSLEPEFRVSALGESPRTAWKNYAEDELDQGRCPRAWSFDPADPESAEPFLKALSPAARARYEACRKGQPIDVQPEVPGPVNPEKPEVPGPDKPTADVPDAPGGDREKPGVGNDPDLPEKSVHNVSRVIAHLALDYKDLRAYDEDPDNFFPSKKKMKQLYGDLSKQERELLKSGDFAKIIEYVLANAPKPVEESAPR